MTVVFRVCLVARIAGRKELAPIGRAAIHIAGVETVDVDVYKSFLSQGKTLVSQELIGLAAAIAVTPRPCLEIAAAGIGLENDIDHSGDGVGTILSSRAIAQHLDSFDRGQRYGVDIDHLGGRPRVRSRQLSRQVAPLAVDQDQCVAGTDATERRRAYALAFDGILALRKVERRMQFRERFVDGDRSGRL